MKQSELSRFALLYQAARYLGTDTILRRHLGVDNNFVTPLGVSHGVDFGQMRAVMDVNGVEPIYWAYNQELGDRAALIKPTVVWPHPFILAARHASAPAKEPTGLLVVGPPPGPEHDNRLLSLIRGTPNATVLIKPKHNFGASAAFWRENGFEVTTIADGGDPSYDNMVRVFARYERVAACTFSSALFFASALGKAVELIRGYKCRVWEAADIEKCFDFESRRAAAVGKLFASSDNEAKTAFSGQILGANLTFDPSEMRAMLDTLIAQLREPFHFSAKYPKLLRFILGRLALRHRRPGLISNPPQKLLQSALQRDVVLQELDDISLWIEGRTATNPRLTRHRYRPEITVPGNAVDGYV